MTALLILLALSLPPGATKGPTYEVMKRDKVIATKPSVWFHTRPDYERFVYRLLRKHSPKDAYQNVVTKQGALLATAHARKAGGHWLTPKKTRGPLKGWNLWGMTAGKKYQKQGGLYFMKGKPWRYFTKPKRGAEGWFEVMARYPDALAQLYKPTPNVKAYVVGLCYGEGGRSYMKCPGAKAGKLDPDYVAGWTNDLQVSMTFSQKHLQAEGFVF